MTQGYEMEAGTVPAVETGKATFTVKHAGGTMQVPEQMPLFPAGKTVDLTDEGVLVFADVNAKGQAGRREKLKDPKGDGSPGRTHLRVLFFSEEAKKYGGLVCCVGCGEAIRVWTSDMHQKVACDGCKAKLDRARAKAARAAKPA